MMDMADLILPTVLSTREIGDGSMEHPWSGWVVGEETDLMGCGLLLAEDEVVNIDDYKDYSCYGFSPEPYGLELTVSDDTYDGDSSTFGGLSLDGDLVDLMNLEKLLGTVVEPQGQGPHTSVYEAFDGDSGNILPVEESFQLMPSDFDIFDNDVVDLLKHLDEQVLDNEQLYVVTDEEAYRGGEVYELEEGLHEMTEEVCAVEQCDEFSCHSSSYHAAVKLDSSGSCSSVEEEEGSSDDDDLWSGSRRSKKRKRGLNKRLHDGKSFKVDRVRRKKDQNKKAATRYREKKKIEDLETQALGDFLECKNKELRKEVKDKEQEVRVLRQLLVDILRPSPK